MLLFFRPFFETIYVLIFTRRYHFVVNYNVTCLGQPRDPNFQPSYRDPVERLTFDKLVFRFYGLKVFPQFIYVIRVFVEALIFRA